MVAHWLHGWRARREDAAVARRAIPDDLWKRTLVRYPFLRWRSAEDQLALRRMTSLFLDRKEFSPGEELRLNNAMVVAIAAQACVPVLQLGLSRYDRFVGIVVHADQVVARREVHDDTGVVHEYDDVLAGEAVPGGPVMLSWRDVREGGRASLGTQGYNVVVHEFAHVLDMEDGIADGVPLLPTGITRAQWLAVLEPEFERFEARVDQDPELESVLDPYAATSIDEFFAVVSESFFVDPRGLAAEHASLYALLKQFYRQDPAAFAPR
jgi:hypothetical protein